MNSQLHIFGKCLAKMKKKNVNSMMRDLRPRRGAGASTPRRHRRHRRDVGASTRFGSALGHCRRNPRVRQ